MILISRASYLIYIPSDLLINTIYSIKMTTATDRQKYIANRLETGGIVVVLETVTIVHTCDEQDNQWKAIICGIPAISAKNNCCSIHVADLDSGETVFKCEVEKFAYASASENFHVFAVENIDGHEDHYGLAFADAALAKKAMAAVEQLSACALADEVDGTLKRTKKGVEISHPTDFKHHSHVATNTPISALIAALTGTATERPGVTDSAPAPVTEPVLSTLSIATETINPTTTIPAVQDTTPPPPFQGALPPPPPPPPPIKPPPPPLQLPLRGRTRTLPAIPPSADQGALISELAKFSRATLRRVNKDTLSQSTNMPDSAVVETDLTKILKSSLNRMRPKFQSEFTASCVTVCNDGTESGKDDFDGPLFV